MSDEIIIGDDEAFFLHPGMLALATTLESVKLPANIIGWLDGRSSLARLGLMVHVTAHRIDPGWEGKIVLEFYNSGKLPLALRSCFYPLLKERINGKLGDLIDIMALLATLFGVITTLGFGASQLGAGLHQLGWISENSFSLQVVVIAVVMSLAIFSAISGVGKGVKILSELNFNISFLFVNFRLSGGTDTLFVIRF